MVGGVRSNESASGTASLDWYADSILEKDGGTLPCEEESSGDCEVDESVVFREEAANSVGVE